MRKLTLFSMLVVLLCFGTVGQAQSRRGNPSSTEKTNQRERPPEPRPTPPDTAEPAPEESGEVISVDTKLVTIPVRVLDRKNRFIGGLKQENFSIQEDGVTQELAYFSNEAQPFTVALVLDMSYSSTFKIADIQNAAIAFIDQLRPEDKVIVISFDEEVHILCEPTTDRKQIYAAIRSTRIATGTSLYEAVDRTMNDRLRSIQGRRAVVLFTDGVDTTSRASSDLDNLRDAMEFDALIYPIRYDTYADVQAMKNRPQVNVPPGLPVPDSSVQLPPNTPGTLPASLPFPFPTNRTGRSGTSYPRGDPRNDPRNDRRNDPRKTGRDSAGDPFPGTSRPPIGMPGQRGTTREEYDYGQEYLDQLAVRTGGRVYVASTLLNLNAAFAKIASELREFYSIGYYPTEEGMPGKTRRIKVKVDQENLVVRARDSYVVPGERKTAGPQTR